MTYENSVLEHEDDCKDSREDELYVGATKREYDPDCEEERNRPKNFKQTDKRAGGISHVFCDRFGAETIALADVLFVDGTFSITPMLSPNAGRDRYPYGQVWVLHAGFDGRKKRPGQTLEAHEKRQ